MTLNVRAPGRPLQTVQLHTRCLSESVKRNTFIKHLLGPGTMLSTRNVGISVPLVPYIIEIPDPEQHTHAPT